MTFLVQFFCVFLLPLLNLFCFCYVLAISVLYCAYPCMKCPLDLSNFLEEISSLSTVFFPLFLRFVHLRKPSYLSLLFSGTLHLVGYIFPFLPCLSLLIYPSPNSTINISLYLLYHIPIHLSISQYIHLLFLFQCIPM